MPKKVFISYRREDTAAAAGRVYDRLARVLAKPNVFFDVSTIAGGEDFVQRIAAEITKSDAALVFIGDKWLEQSAPGGRARIFEPDDYVRAELRATLSRPVLILPVLVGGAHMPKAELLPEDIRAITTKNALPLRHESFDDDTENIVAAVLGLKAGERAWEERPLGTRIGATIGRCDSGVLARALCGVDAFLGDGASAFRFDRCPTDDDDPRRCSARRRLDRLALQGRKIDAPVMRRSLTHRPVQTRSARRRSPSARSSRDCAAHAPTSGLERHATTAGPRRACRTKIGDARGEIHVMADDRIVEPRA